MIDLCLKGVVKRFGSTVAADGIDLEVRHSEWFSLVGPSGCGKTTTLRMIAGFARPDAGVIEIKGKNVTSEPPYRRNTGMVFQNYALFPHMTVFENIAYGLRLRRFPPADIKKKVEELLALVQLEGLGHRYPTRELSGGQQQRVALARALIIEPDVLLLDEPLSNLDAKLREELRVEMSILQQRLNITTVYVTHDQQEALSMSSRIAVMNEGRLEQIGSPQEIYERPVSLFVAGFIGKVNLIKGEVVAPNRGGITEILVRTSRGNFPLQIMAAKIVSKGAQIDVAVRPERIHLLRGEEGDRTNVIEAIVQHVSFYGGEIGYRLSVGDKLILSVSEKNLGQSPLKAGQRANLKLRSEDCFLLG